MSLRAGYVSLLVLLLLVLVACGGPSSPPPKPQFELRDLTFEWGPVASWARGRLVNVGTGKAQYVEVGIKVTPPDDPNYIIAKGWGNAVNVEPGMNVPMDIVLTGDIPTGEWTYHWRWSTEVGKAMY